jgi:hypothetical protein
MAIRRFIRQILHCKIGDRYVEWQNTSAALSGGAKCLKILEPMTGLEPVTC